MKVLQLMSYSVKDIEEYIKRGGEYHGHNLYGYDEFKKKGIDITWLSPDYNNRILLLFATITGIKNNFMRICLQIDCIIKSKDYDIIYSPHDIHLIVLALLRLTGICRKPVYMICHFSYNLKYVKSPFKRFYKRIERFLVYTGIDKISFLNENLMSMAIEDCQIPQRHRNYVNWGAKLDFFNEFKLIIKEKPTLNFFVSIGSANRDYNTLTKAFLKIKSTLIIFGRKDESLNITNPIPSNVIFDKTIIPGLNSVVQLRNYYYNCIAVLIPIQNENDVSNGITVFIEALAIGKPIIITDMRANIDVVKEKIGLKVGKGDIEGWQNAINWLLKNPKEAIEMGNRAKKLAFEKYNYNLFCDKVLFNLENTITK